MLTGPLLGSRRQSPLPQTQSDAQTHHNQIRATAFYRHFIGNGERFFAELEKLGIEGMVAKKKNGLYVSGKTRDWLKIKTSASREEMKRRIETWGH